MTSSDIGLFCGEGKSMSNSDIGLYIVKENQ